MTKSIAMLSLTRSMVKKKNIAKHTLSYATFNTTFYRLNIESNKIFYVPKRSLIRARKKKVFIYSSLFCVCVPPAHFRPSSRTRPDNVFNTIFGTIQKFIIVKKIVIKQYNIQLRGASALLSISAVNNRYKKNQNAG